MNSSKQFASSHYMRGLGQYKAGMYNLAVVQFTKAIKIDPSEPKYYLNRALSNERIGKYEEAIIDYTTLIEFAPHNAHYYYQRAVVYHWLRNDKPAMEDYNMAIELDPRYIDALINRAGLKQELNQHHEALSDYEDILKLDPHSKECFAFRAKSYLALGQYSDAISDYTAALFLNPKWGICYYGRAICYFGLGFYIESKKDFDKAVSYGPKNALFWIARSQYYLLLGIYDRALLDCHRALQLQPNNLDFMQLKSLIQMHLGYYNEAIEQLKNCVDTDSKVIETRCGLILAYCLNGDWENAFKIVNLSHNRSKPEIRSVYYAILCCYTFLEKGDIQSAEKCLSSFSKTISRYPKKVQANLIIAQMVIDIVNGKSEDFLLKFENNKMHITFDLFLAITILFEKYADTMKSLIGYMIVYFVNQFPNSIPIIQLFKRIDDYYRFEGKMIAQK